jgi:hypothetical protein
VTEPDSGVGEGVGSVGGGSLFPESRPDIPTDDWDDQDLLTKDEASLRLEHSARLARTELAQLGGSDPVAAAALEDQIRKIELVLKNIRDR